MTDKTQALEALGRVKKAPWGKFLNGDVHKDIETIQKHIEGKE